MTTPTTDTTLPVPLPSTDPFLAEPGLDLPALARHWRPIADRSAMSGEAMRGADHKAQRLGVSGERLMEEAGAAVAAAVRALLVTTERTGHGPVLVLAGPGNNGGDGSVAARSPGRGRHPRRLRPRGHRGAPTTADARLNWERLEGTDVERIHAANERDIRFLLAGIEKAAVIVDALLGSGVHGPLREPIRTAVDLVIRGRAAGVPVLAVDTPTAVDLTGGQASDPVVRADVTVTFHRPKLGHATRVGKALAGRVLVAPIGIPAAADPRCLTQGPARTLPTWLKVVAVGGGVVLVVGLVALVGLLVPPVGEAIQEGARGGRRARGRDGRRARDDDPRRAASALTLPGSTLTLPAALTLPGRAWRRPASQERWPRVKSSLRSWPWIRRSMLSAWASQTTTAPAMPKTSSAGEMMSAITSPSMISAAAAEPSSDPSET